MKEKALHDWLSYIERVHPKSVDLGLERIRLVADKLHLLPFPLPAVTVSGTNGKGSCVKLLATILQAAGLQVGSYFSPHLIHYNERILINNNEVSDVQLCHAFSEIEAARADISLTYFEFSTLAALLVFKKSLLDIIILEVGLGGRLDAVNLVDADIAVIASIGMDHTDWLGGSRESIAREKAGIFRAHMPAVCGDPNPPDIIYALAKQYGVPLFVQGKDFHYHMNNKNWYWYGPEQKITNLPLPKLLLQNAATALMVLQLLKNKCSVPLAAIKSGLATTTLPGRMQPVVVPGRAVTVILDVAHNPEAATLLAQHLQQHCCTGKTYAVFSIFADKDIAATAQPLQPYIDTWYVSKIDYPRAATTHEIATQLETVGIYRHAINLSETIAMAFDKALAKAKPGDRIVIFGSFHTIRAMMTVPSMRMTPR